MKVNQIYEIINSITNEVTGKSDIVAEDLSNIIDVGKEIFDNTAVDNYVKSLVNHIGKVIFVNREYKGTAPTVLMDSWEYGSVLEKIQCEIPEAVQNDSWNLADGTSYDVNVFHAPKVSAKFYNNKNTFEIAMSFTEMQVKESFSDVNQLNGFMSMIYSAISRSMSIKTDSMIMRTINNMTAQTIANDFPNVSDNNYGTSDSPKAINLLKRYNTANSTTLTAKQAINNPDFIRYASFEMALTVDRMKKMSTLFNIGGKERFTPNDLLHIVMLSDFEKASEVFLQSDTYHDTLVKLPNAETVPFWQGSGTTYDFDTVSKINVTTNGDGAKNINIGGILAVMFDRDSLGVCNYNERVTTNYNAKGEFFNNYYKYDCGYFNDSNENFVVFFVA